MKSIELSIKNCIAGTSMLVFVGEESFEIQKENGEMITFDEMMSNLYSMGLAHDGETLGYNPLTEELAVVLDSESNIIAIVHKNVWSS